MDAAFEKVVIEALDALESGESAGAILARYPEHEAELRPILMTASSLVSMRVAHSLEAQAASRQRMLEHAAAASVAVSRGPALFQFMRRLSLTLAGLLIVLGLLGTGMLFASSEAVPGDALYDAKRFFEDTRLSLTSDAVAREELQQLLEETRVREVKTLLRMGRTEDATFIGIIEAIDDEGWLVAGIEVVILDSTSITGAGHPAVGDLVEVSGVTTDGHVNAEIIVIRAMSSLPDPTPDPDSVETPAIEPTPTNTATPTPTATRTPTPTATNEATTPMRTSTPTRESNENGNDNDNENQGNDNENENEVESNGNDGGNGNESNGNGSGNDNDNEGNENGSNDNDNHNENDNDNDDFEENENNSNENRNDNENRNENDS